MKTKLFMAFDILLLIITISVYREEIARSALYLIINYNNLVTRATEEPLDTDWAFDSKADLICWGELSFVLRCNFATDSCSAYTGEICFFLLGNNGD